MGDLEELLQNIPEDVPIAVPPLDHYLGDCENPSSITESVPFGIVLFSEGRCSVILRASLLNCQYIALAPDAFQLVVHTELPQYSPKTI